ncbi:MAG: hypothetical protein JWN41_970 [Thermoleophilia bacterium]|nr:hypothetical protein [Thermoleophilia bacterium]
MVRLTGTGVPYVRVVGGTLAVVAPHSVAAAAALPVGPVRGAHPLVGVAPTQLAALCPAPPTSSDAAHSPDLSPWHSLGHLADRRLSEVSGVAVGRAHPSILWVHNDSGDRPRIFAIRTDGSLVGEIQFDGALAHDWEDIAIGPGPRAAGDAPWLYTADIGDNGYLRRSIQLYRTPEPDPLSRRVRPEKITLHYPDRQARNAETLLVDPRTGDVTIVCKLDRRADVFTISRDELDAGGGSLHAAGSFALQGRATGGDVSPDGSTVVVRTYERVYVFARRPGQSVADALRGTPSEGAAPPSEAVTFSSDGGSLISIDEGVGAEILTRTMPDAHHA